MTNVQQAIKWLQNYLAGEKFHYDNLATLIQALEEARAENEWLRGELIALARRPEQVDEEADLRVENERLRQELEWAVDKRGYPFVGFSKRDEEGGFFIVSYAPDWVRESVFERCQEIATKARACLDRAKEEAAQSADEATAIAQETGQYDDHILYETGDPGTPDAIKDRNGEVCLGLCKVCGAAERELDEHPCNQWRTHDSHEPPTDLAAAQKVHVCWREGDSWEGTTARVDNVPWECGLRYRPALSANGLPLCSGEGLEPWAWYVVWHEGHRCWYQYEAYPCEGYRERSRPAPDSHRKPGPASESLMEVSRG